MIARVCGCSVRRTRWRARLRLVRRCAGGRTAAKASNKPELKGNHTLVGNLGAPTSTYMGHTTTQQR